MEGVFLLSVFWFSSKIRMRFNRYKVLAPVCTQQRLGAQVRQLAGLCVPFPL